MMVSEVGVWSVVVVFIYTFSKHIMYDLDRYLREHDGLIDIVSSMRRPILLRLTYRMFVYGTCAFSLRTVVAVFE
jgi:hypothetical protein